MRLGARCRGWLCRRRMDEPAQGASRVTDDSLPSMPVCRPTLSQLDRTWILWLLAGILVARLLTLGAYPLADPSEARYGEIARKMAERGDWVTPWLDVDVPFWGKPPLAFWLSAASIKAIGPSELAVRLPSFVLGLAMLGLTAALAARRRGRDAAIVSLLALAGTGLFFVGSGAVLTDPALAVAVTLAMTGFWLGVHGEDRKAVVWRYSFFLALGIGLLAKGPVVLALVGLPVGAWVVLSGQWRLALSRMPWVSGTLLMLGIAVPWYLLAEHRTPGFLDYFLLGENFKRFTDSSWPGDLYGGVHTRPKGFVWLLWLVSMIPWPFVAGSAVWRLARRRLQAALPGTHSGSSWSQDHWFLYVTLFAVAPCIVFTLAGSVLATYVLPAAPAVALVMTELVIRRQVRPLSLGLAAAVPVVFVLAVPVFNVTAAQDLSQKALLARRPDARPVAYFQKRPYSGAFYSEGRAVLLTNAEALERFLRQEPHSFVVTQGDVIPSSVRSKLRARAVVGYRRAGVLWEHIEGPTPPPETIAAVLPRAAADDLRVAYAVRSRSEVGFPGIGVGRQQEADLVPSR